MRWLYKLEYKYARFGIRNLMTIMVAAMAVVYVLDMLLAIDLLGSLAFSREAILQGQVWRVLTFILIPPGVGSAVMMLISLYCYYMLGNLLENLWGSFKLTVYYLVGIIGAIIAGFVSPMGLTSNSALNASLFLAVAAIMPDTQFRLFFILPIKAKWMAAIYFLFELPNVINAFTIGVGFGLNYLIVLAFSLLNFFLFFGRSLVQGIKNEIRVYKNRRNWNNNNRR